MIMSFKVNKMIWVFGDENLASCQNHEENEVVQALTSAELYSLLSSSFGDLYSASPD